MKKKLALAFFSAISVIAFSQEKSKQPLPKEYQFGAARITVIENKGKDGKTFKKYKVEEVYKKENGELKTTNTFDWDELMDLRENIERVIANEEPIFEAPTPK
jgi:hypothetical protein